MTGEIVNSELEEVWKEAARSLFSDSVNGLRIQEDETSFGLRFEPGTSRA